MADGEASARQVLELRPHLRSCPACRAALREHHGAARRVAALMPAGLVLAATASAHRPGGLVMRTYEALTGGVHERLSASALKLQTAAEAATSGKLAAVAASTAALAGGGGVILHEELETPRRSPVPAVREAAHVRRPPRHRVRLAAEVTPTVAPVPAPPKATGNGDRKSSGAAPQPAAPPAATTPATAPTQTVPAAQREFAPEQQAAAPSSSASSPARPAPQPTRTAAPPRSSGAGSSGEFAP
jgi:hypothetical protein